MLNRSDNSRERAFVASEFKEYNPRVEKHIDRFIYVLKKSEGADINCTKAMDDLVFDVYFTALALCPEDHADFSARMADLSFGNDAGMQAGTGDSSYMDFVHKWVSTLGVCPSITARCH